MDLITAGDIQWPLITPCGENGPDDVRPDLWTAAQALAIEWVWALSGRRFGLFDVVFRPEWTIHVARSARNYVLGSGYRPAYPVVDFATSRPLTQAPLPGPAVTVSQVKVDGVVLATTAYELIGDTLCRVDGGQWPHTQDVTQPTANVGTWQVSYTRGHPVPTGGQLAAGILACEEAKRLTGDKTCRLPNNTTNVARNGVTVNLDAKQPQLGFTTIREVDQWCRTVNPNGNQDSPTVWSPDLDPNLLPPIPAAT